MLDTFQATCVNQERLFMRGDAICAGRLKNFAMTNRQGYSVFHFSVRFSFQTR